MLHSYLRFITGLTEALRRRLEGMAGPSSPVPDVLLFVSLSPALNLYALFTHVLFPTRRHCAACTPDVRGVYGVIAWVFLILFHGLLLMTEVPVQPLPPPEVKQWFAYYKLYLLFSIVLAFV